MQTINLVIGDRGGDGHEKFATYSIKSNFNVLEMKSAFDIGSKIIGYNLIQLCDDYEEDTIPINLLQNIYDRIGLDLIDFDVIDVDGNLQSTDTYKIRPELTVRINHENYAYLYLQIARIGNSDFSYEFLNEEEIEIGGYGLFS